MLEALVFWAHAPPWIVSSVLWAKCEGCEMHLENTRGSLRTGCRKVRDNRATRFVHSERNELRYYTYTDTGTNKGADRKSVDPTGPTDSLPSSSGAPGLVFSSNTQRRKSKRGRGRERENRCDDRCDACCTQPHRQQEETVERETLWHGDGGDWLWCEWTRLQRQTPCLLGY